MKTRPSDNRSDVRPAARTRRGVGLLVCLFVMALTTVVLTSILDTLMLQLTTVRNVGDYERALYLATAGVHHAMAELEQDASWRTGVPATEYPAGSGATYWATAVSGTGTQVIITATGTSGGTTRRLQVVVDTSG